VAPAARRPVAVDVKVLFATAEFAPLARVGGLAAAAAGLVAELRRQGIDVEVVLPDYYDTPLEKETVRPLLDVPEWAGPAIARTGIAAGVGEITLVNAFGIVKSHPYLQPDGSGWPDNDRRFMAYSAALASLTRSVAPDVLHLNDWHTCAALGHLDIAPPTMLTIHTLGYQGRTNPGWLMTLPRHTEAFEQWGDCNPLLGGIRLADVVVTVSPHYAEEIATPEGGFTLDGPLRERGDRLVGILNGIDDEEWNPETDRHLEVTYSAADVSAATGSGNSKIVLIDKSRPLPSARRAERSPGFTRTRSSRSIAKPRSRRRSRIRTSSR